VLETPAEAEPATVVIVAEPVLGGAAATRDRIDGLAKLIADGGVLALAVLALGDGATEELERQQAFSGAGSDLVLRNWPPVRVHRLRYTPAPVPAAGLAPAYRSSSVPLTQSMHIDSNGVAAAGIALGLAVAARLARRRSGRASRASRTDGWLGRALPGRTDGWLGRALPGRAWLLPALAAAPVAAFFRDPERAAPADESAVVAASDGTVLSVQRLTDARFGAGEWLRVAVFLSVLDVHVNRAPVAGRVVEHRVEEGGYAPAMRPAAEHNVAAYTVLETEHGRVVVAQRTGLVARRIVHRAPVGSVLARGERFGLIRFGSRTDVYLPAGAAQPAVAPGDRVLGGHTVIARWL
ncbi:MAG: phosphatidylserine decarboxylase, partial [Micromonosporaceae bacterium]|nr:phosphatidylserine decarboxylase [Micromonosporaceae bacterium]